MSAAAPERDPTPTTAEQHRWLTGELRAWEQDGLITASTAAAIEGRYAIAPDTTRRVNTIRVILGLGASFLGVGLIWFVATNLDKFSPLVRFVGLVLVWIALAVVAELTRDLVAAALKLLTAVAAGAVVFQAAQSLQVPAFEPQLLLAWGLGALLYAYARRSRAAGFVAITVLAVWYVWQVMESSASILTFTGAVLLASVASVGLAALHPKEWAGFGRLWLTLGAVMSLIGVFAAALPYSDGPRTWSNGVTAGIVLALGIAAAALWRSSREVQFEIALSVAALVLGMALSLWRPKTYFTMTPDAFTPEMWIRTGLAILVYLLVAASWAVVGARRELGVVSAVATVAVVIFTTFQAFAVFAPIVSASILFLIVGAVMLITGVVAERARRRIGSEVRSS